MADLNKRHEATEQMFALIGWTITEWSFVEERLCSIFTICTSPVLAHPGGALESLDSQVPIGIFYSVENFRAKLGMVDAAVTNRIIGTGDWVDELKGEWRRLHDKARKLSLKRNRLAHWTVLPAYWRDDETLGAARLVPPFGSLAYYRETGWNPTNATMKPLHVEHLARAFGLLSEKLRAFAYSLARQEELFDKDVRLLARQILSLDQLDPTRAERLRRGLSSPE